MEKIIVTSGKPFIDIDALACSTAYCELLRSEGKAAKVIHTGTLNSSITQSIKKWSLNFITSYNNEDSVFVLVDVSDPDHFESFVVATKISEVFDHRHGFENYWVGKLGKNSHIEMVGSCATLIWEEFEKRNSKNISVVSANLLTTAIISNTLNFKSSNTTKRDTDAYFNLSKHSSLDKKWTEKYYEEIDNYVSQNLEFTIKNDTKSSGQIIAQLELWNAKNIILKNYDKLIKIMESYKNEDWFLTSPSIEEGMNYIICKNKDKKLKLEKAIGVKFDGDFGTTNKLWLRKEIVRELNK